MTASCLVSLKIVNVVVVLLIVVVVVIHTVFDGHFGLLVSICKFVLTHILLSGHSWCIQISRIGMSGTRDVGEVIRVSEN